MDLIRFTGPEPTVPILGELVGGYSSLMIVERYSEESEFEIKAPIGSDLKELLPIGSLVAEQDGDLPFIVENHEISTDEEDLETELIISGRSFETITEQFAVGADTISSIVVVNVGLGKSYDDDYTWNQAMYLINESLATPLNPDDVLPNMIADVQDDILARVLATGHTPELYPRQFISPRYLYKTLLDLLAIEGLGLTSTWRPWGTETTMRLYIYKGVDRSDTVVFSHYLDDLAEANYLWSNKKVKNAALVFGTWVSMTYRGTPTNYDRRWLLVDGTDIDQGYESEPDAGAKIGLTPLFEQRGKEALMAQKEVALAQAKTNSNNQHLYGRDYQLGDIVLVQGDYATARKMQVVEYVKIDDETGESGYPTFAPI